MARWRRRVRQAWQASAVPASKSPRRGDASAPPWHRAAPAPVVLVSGPEALLGSRAVNLIVEGAKAKDPETDVHRIEAATYTPGLLRSAASPSLFGGTAMVIVEGAESMSDAFLTDALEYVAAPDPEAVVVIRHGGGNRGKKLLDAARAAGVPEYACPAVTRDSDLVDFTAAEFSRANRTASAAAVRALVDSVGSDVSQIAAACAQLVMDVDGGIDEGAVTKYYGTRVNATGFAVADAAAVGDRSKALTLVRHALETGTDPVPLVAAIAAKLRTLAKVGAARGRGVDPTRDLGIAPWQVDRARRELRNWDAERLARAIELVAAADHAVKGGDRAPAFTVERLVRQVADLAADV